GGAVLRESKTCSERLEQVVSRSSRLCGVEEPKEELPTCTRLQCKSTMGAEPMLATETAARELTESDLAIRGVGANEPLNLVIGRQAVGGQVGQPDRSRGEVQDLRQLVERRPDLDQVQAIGGNEELEDRVRIEGEEPEVLGLE